MKTIRLAIVGILLAINVFAVYSTLSEVQEVREQYQLNVDEARAAAEEGLIPAALESYDKALEEDNNIDLLVEVGNLYLDNDMMRDAESHAERILGLYPDGSKAYEYMMRVNIANEEYIATFETYDAALARDALSDGVKQFYQDIEYTFTYASQNLTGSRPYRNNFWLCDTSYSHQDSAWAAFTANGNSKGQARFFEASSVNQEGVIGGRPTAEDEWGYYNTDGFKVVNIPDFKNISYVGEYSEEIPILIVNDEEYAFYNHNFELLFGPYQDASQFVNGLAFVQGEDELWQVIKQDGSLLLDEQFEDVVINENLLPSLNGSFFAKKDGSYRLYDINGEQIPVEHELEDAKLFVELDGLAAVKIAGKWGLLDKTGQLVVPAEYEELNSSSHGLAAFKDEEGLWGYIGIDDQEIKIKAQFERVLPFNEQGVTVVEEAKRMYFLLLYRDNR